MDGALAKVLAERDTQSREIPANTDSDSTVDTELFVDSNDTHDQDIQNTESETNQELENDQEDFETSEVEETEDQDQEQTSETTESIDERLASLEKQRADQQSYFMNQINELNSELKEFKEPKEEPVKSMSDEELNDLFYENPAEAMRVMNARNAPNPVNQQVAIQEGVQRALHADYDDVINVVKQQATLNPQLEQEIMNSPDPAKTAYEKGQALRKAQQIQIDPAKFEADLRAKILAETSSNKTNMPTRVGGVRSTAPNLSNASQSDYGATRFSKTYGKKRK